MTSVPQVPSKQHRAGDDHVTHSLPIYFAIINRRCCTVQEDMPKPTLAHMLVESLYSTSVWYALHQVVRMGKRHLRLAEHGLAPFAQIKEYLRVHAAELSTANSDVDLVSKPATQAAAS